ncbi:glycosyl hydrolase 53 family protein [Nonomuraea jabiensis]|uniref:glycosyl hydrolase 53 family protein n=1 Tax=Nonomuraea jabiensis TaxID=882448 RepID=UPI00368FAAC6
MADMRTPVPAELSRRAVLLGAGALALGAGTGTPQAQAATFVKGADLSWMPQMEAQGRIWRNGAGAAQDLFTILKGYGITAIRLRTWVNPSSDPVHGHCAVEETAAMAVRCKNPARPPTPRAATWPRCWTTCTPSRARTANRSCTSSTAGR